MKRKWFDKKVLILGLSKSGVSAAKYLSGVGADVWLSEYSELDENQKALADELQKEGIKIESGGHSDEFLEDAYLAVTSPGIPPSAEIFARLQDKNIQVISEIELAYLETTTPFVAITGTNGKTTTTALISHILESEYPESAPFCGNIGVPPTSLIGGKKLDFLVCEVSSYQADFSPTFRPQIACYLNFTPDHVSWHGSLENYYNAKAKLFAAHKKPAFAVLNALDESVAKLAENFTDEEVFFFGKELDKNCSYIADSAIYFKGKKDAEKIIELQEIKLVGEHNYQNVMCAVIVAKILGLENEQIKEAIRSFKPIEHRCEFVEKLGELEFYNDSKATNPESSIVAINSFPNMPITLIAGGRDKNTDLGEFCSLINQKVSNVVLIGEAAERFEQNLRNIGYTNILNASSLEEAVDKAIELGNRIILFSPACASFDMFNNYEERGEAFKRYVTSKI